MRLEIRSASNNWKSCARMRFVRGSEVEIRADRPFTVYADGDPIGELPVHIRVAPSVLRVLVPSS